VSDVITIGTPYISRIDGELTGTITREGFTDPLPDFPVSINVYWEADALDGSHPQVIVNLVSDGTGDVAALIQGTSVDALAAFATGGYEPAA